MSQPEDNLRGYVTLKQIVNFYLSEKNMLGGEQEMRLLDLLIRGHMQVVGIYEDKSATQYIQLNSLNIGQLPPDYLMYVRVGVNINERWWTLTYNPNMIIPFDEECGIRERDMDKSNNNVSSDVEFFPHYIGETYISNLYGRRGGYNIGYFTIDKSRWEIVVEGDMVTYGSKIILDYVSTGIRKDGLTKVPMLAVEPLIAWLDWKVKFSDRYLYSLNEAKEAENQFGIALDEYRIREYKFTKDDYMDEIYLSRSQSIKRG